MSGDRSVWRTSSSGVKPRRSNDSFAGDPKPHIAFFQAPPYQRCRRWSAVDREVVRGAAAAKR
jgi:hypothetical protein